MWLLSRPGSGEQPTTAIVRGLARISRMTASGGFAKAMAHPPRRVVAAQALRRDRVARKPRLFDPHT